MGGIATITLNAALDRTLQVDRIRIGGKSPVLREWVQAGGKGVNVARVLRALGAETLAIVVVGGETGRAIVEDLGRSELPSECIEAPGESRTCLEIVAEDGRAAQLHGAGLDGGTDVIERVIAAVESLPARFGWIAVCGSLAPGMPTDAVRRLVASARESGRRVAIDTRGPALADAWAISPDLVRVNEAELREVLPHGSGVTPPFPALGQPALGVVSRGARPYPAWTSNGERLRVTPPEIEAVNPIGCGDAMMAGLLAAMDGGAPFESALRRATALATAEAHSTTAGTPDVALARTLEDRVVIEKSPK